MTRAELKERARMQIRGKIGILFLISLITGLVYGAALGLSEIIPLIGPVLVAVLVDSPFSLSSAVIYLRITRGIKPHAEDAFLGFKNYGGIVGLSVVRGILVMLWTLLFIVPGLIKGYAYSMSTFILVDQPHLGATEALRLSQEMMKGHKMELFVLELSFLGWMLLSVITLGILSIWLEPYQNATFANFYIKVRDEYYVETGNRPTYLPEKKLV